MPTNSWVIKKTAKVRRIIVNTSSMWDPQGRAPSYVCLLFLYVLVSVKMQIPYCVLILTL